MPDVFTKEQRSKVMRHIRAKDNKPETMVRKYLWHHGFRYRKNDKSLPGTPDIVISKYRTAIFINGCFWHHHPHCRLAYIPKSKTAYWIKKFSDNMERDIENQKQLEEKEFTAAAGGGAVEVTVSGKREVTKVKLQEDVVDPDDIEMLEDLIVAATNEALRKVEEESSAVMSKLTGGLGGGFPF